MVLIESLAYLWLSCQWSSCRIGSWLSVPPPCGDSKSLYSWKYTTYRIHFFSVNIIVCCNESNAVLSRLQFNKGECFKMLFCRPIKLLLSILRQRTCSHALVTRYCCVGRWQPRDRGPATDLLLQGQGARRPPPAAGKDCLRLLPRTMTHTSLLNKC